MESNALLNEMDGMSESLELNHWVEAGKPANAAVQLSGDADLDELYVELAACQSIEIAFPVFMDGRGFSHARKLRDLGFTGELIAAGDVLPDQWQYLQRCGFSSMADASAAENANSLPRFSEPYQSDVLEAEPLFRRAR